MDILTARVTGRYATGVRRRVPTVDGGIELDAGIGTFPGSFSHLSKQVPSPDRLKNGSVGYGPQIPFIVGHYGLHELVGNPNRVVGVLIHDRMAVHTVETHVEASLLKSTDLSFLAGLAPDELLDVRMADVEDDHLGGPPGSTSTLDSACRGISTPHKTDGSTSHTATSQGLLRRSDCTEVDPRPGTALENRSLLDVPIQYRRHLVVYREDETSRCLLGHPGNPDVEPNRRVERSPLSCD